MACSAVDTGSPESSESELGAIQEASQHCDEPTVIKIGALVDQTGTSTSPHFTYAVELAFAQMNEALGYGAGNNDYPEFVPVFGDTKSTPAIARDLALNMINVEQVHAIVGDSSGDSVQVNRLNYDTTGMTIRKVPMTCFQCSSGFFNSPTATDPDPLTQLGFRDADNWMFRVFFNAGYEAVVMLRIAMQTNNGDVNGDGLFKIDIYNDGGHASSAAALIAALPTMHPGPNTWERFTYTTPANIPVDLPKLTDSLNESTVPAVNDGLPDTVLVAALPGAVTPVVQQYRAAGYTIPLQSVNAFRRDYILAAVGATANGLEGSSVAVADDSPSGDAFINAFEDEFGAPPELTSSGAYDSAVTLMLATLVAQHKRHGRADLVTPADIREGLTKINHPNGTIIRPTVKDFKKAAKLILQGKKINYQGAFDPIDWDAAGDMFPPLVHWKVENAQFVEYERYDCTPATPDCPVIP
jgi:ABC-type branched-subunit amino acid transport system substrate-binding protein